MSIRQDYAADQRRFCNNAIESSKADKDCAVYGGPPTESVTGNRAGSFTALLLLLGSLQSGMYRFAKVSMTPLTFEYAHLSL